MVSLIRKHHKSTFCANISKFQLIIIFFRLKAIQKLSTHVNVEVDDPIHYEELQDLNKDILKRNEQLNQVRKYLYMKLI